MQKYTEEKCLYRLDAGTVGIQKFLGFLIMLVF